MVRCLPGAPSWSFKICSMASSRKASLLVILAFFLGYGESGRTLPLWEVGSSGDGSEVLVHDLRRRQALVTHLDNVSQMSSILLFVPSGLKECAKSRCDIDKRYTCWLFLGPYLHSVRKPPLPTSPLGTVGKLYCILFQYCIRYATLPPKAWMKTLF